VTFDNHYTVVTMWVKIRINTTVTFSTAVYQSA